MLNHPTQIDPGPAGLFKATGVALIVASAVLVFAVLPAEYGIDPTGVGKRIGLSALSASTADSAKNATAEIVPNKVAAGSDLAASALAVFGKESPGQSFDAKAFTPATAKGLIRAESFELTLEPGKGAEVKMHMKQGDGVTFHWKATDLLLLDMHGERPNPEGTWTSYAIEPAVSEASGTFVAPFEGTHGWYWKNENDAPVNVTVEVSGFQTDLYRP